MCSQYINIIRAFLEGTHLLDIQLLGILLFIMHKRTTSKMKERQSEASVFPVLPDSIKAKSVTSFFWYLIGRKMFLETVNIVFTISFVIENKCHKQKF